MSCAKRSSRPARPEVSEATAECVRIEHGRPRYGVELDDGVIPQEAGLNERAVSFTKGCYVGQETVARLLLPGQAEPPAARAAPFSAGRAGVRAAARRARGRATSRARPSRRGSARSRSRSSAARPSSARRSRSATRSPLRSSSCRSTDAAHEPLERVALRRRVECELRHLRVRGEIGRDDPHLVDLVRGHVRPELAGAPASPERCLRALVDRVGRARQRSPVDEPPAREPERVASRRVGRVRGEHQPGPRVGRLEHAPEAL